MKSPKAHRPLEREIQRPVLELLGLLGIPHMRNNAGGGYRLGKGGRPQLIGAAPKGWPDIIGWLPGDGRFLGIEVKRPGEEPTPDQLAVLMRINADGGVGFWTSDLGHCREILGKVAGGWSIDLDAGKQLAIEGRR